MKKILLFSLIICFCFTAQAQFESTTETVKIANELKIGKFKIKKFHVSFGEDNDMINNMSYEYFVNQIPADRDFPLRDRQFSDSDFNSGHCENPNLTIGLTLEHPALRNIQWRNSLSIMSDRSDGVSYYEPDNSGTGDYVNFFGGHSEYGIESAVLYKLQLLPAINLYGGLGTNMGVSSGDYICYDATYRIPESLIEGAGSDAGVVEGYDTQFGCIDTNSQFNQRLFAEFGIGMTILKRVEIGVNFKNGIGYRAGNGALAGTQLNAFNISLAYVLK